MVREVIEWPKIIPSIASGITFVTLYLVVVAPFMSGAKGLFYLLGVYGAYMLGVRLYEVLYNSGSGKIEWMK